MEQERNEMWELIKQASANEVQETAFYFEDENIFRIALNEVVKEGIIRGKPLSFRPLGEPIGIIPNNSVAAVENLLREKGINFETRRVGSMGELTPEERRELKRTGRRIG